MTSSRCIPPRSLSGTTSAAGGPPRDGRQGDQDGMFTCLTLGMVETCFSLNKTRKREDHNLDHVFEHEKIT